MRVSKNNELPDLKQFRQRLLDRKKAILLENAIGASGTTTVALDQTSVGRVSRIDALQTQAMSLAAQERRVVELGRIAAALQRIDAGEYGYCLDCGELISSERLKIDLPAERCVKCASKLEK